MTSNMIIDTTKIGTYLDIKKELIGISRDINHHLTTITIKDHPLGVIQEIIPGEILITVYTLKSQSFHSSD